MKSSEENVSINLIDFIYQENNNLNQTVAAEFEENNVSELHMHKILYLLFGLFYRKFKRDLFADANFEAWKYGPVEVDFRIAFKNKALKGLTKFNLVLTKAEIVFLTKLTKKFLCYSPWLLVDITHTSDPWSNNYNDQMISRNKITVEEIHKNFSFVINE